MLSAFNSNVNQLHSRDSMMQMKIPEVSVVRFGRASQIVKRNSLLPQQGCPVRTEEFGNGCSTTQSNCVADCSKKKDTDEITSGVKRKNVRMVWMDDYDVRNCSITQLPHPSQLRKRRKQHYKKTKPLGFDFMYHVQQLHRKREEFESMKNDNTNSGNFMHVRAVRSQTKVPTNAENVSSNAQETEEHLSALVAHSPPRMRERSFNLFPFSEKQTFC